MVKRDFMGRTLERAEMSLSIGVNVSCQSMEIMFMPLGTLGFAFAYQKVS